MLAAGKAITGQGRTKWGGERGGKGQGACERKWIQGQWQMPNPAEYRALALGMAIPEGGKDHKRRKMGGSGDRGGCMQVCVNVAKVEPIHPWVSLTTTQNLSL